MSDPMKRKRLDKMPEDIPPTLTAIAHCHRCGTGFSRLKGNFPVSHSPMYRGTGYLPWCNECIDEMYKEYKAKLGDKEAMYRMCMKLDLYWNESIYEMVDRQAGVNSRVRTYIGKSNMIRFIDKTFDDTLREEASSDKGSFIKSAVSDSNAHSETADKEIKETDPDIVAFWGTGYTPDFYSELERRYREWTGGASVIDPGQRALYKQICILEVLINRDAAEGRPVKGNVDSLNTLLGSMNLKPSQQKSDADAELEKMPLGVGIEKWEYYRPLPTTGKSKRDINGLIRNIHTWFLGHGGKMVGLKNSHVQMYEDAMDGLRVKRPEYEDEDDDTMLTDIFGNSKIGGDND